MDTSEPETPASARHQPRRPWIRYRVEHRNRRTNELISHRDTPGPDLEADDKDVDKPAFALVTTFKTDPFLASQAMPAPLMATSTVTASPPSYALHLYSPAIVNALQTVVQYYPSHDLTGDIVVQWPYPILVHHYDELAKFREDTTMKDEADLCIRERDAYEHIGLLLKFLDDSVMPEVHAEKERNEKGFYTFEHAWVAMKPGVTMLSELKNSQHPKAYVIHSVSGGVFDSVHGAWDVRYWYMRYDGEYLGRHMGELEVDKFDGQREWQSDEFQPVEVGDFDKTDLSAKVKNQLQYGETYWRLLQKQCRHYRGKTQDFPHNEVNGPVMVDLESYFASEGTQIQLMEASDCRNWTTDCKCVVCKNKDSGKERKALALFEDYNYIEVETGDTLTTHQYFLCSYEIMAFVFRTRTWEPEFDETMIDNLVMDLRRKRTLQSLAKSFARVDKHGDVLNRQPWAAGFVNGKGNGLIFLLHGRPGVGKTCTAECIAAFTKRPLMIITASDIGTNPLMVETNLTKNFKRARSWDAVLLIDEADVFMERRSTEDLVRNSLVAGFLRALEFYDGILFLTTNRVGSFDDAFISRIHIQLYYPDFDDEQRRQVWQTFIDKLAKDRGDCMRLNVDAKDYIRGAEMRALKWNGREIRNAFQTAVSLAEYDAEKGEDGKIVVTDDHLRAVVELSKDFKDYLNELHKGDEGKRAERKYERLDSYDAM